MSVFKKEKKKKGKKKKKKKELHIRSYRNVKSRCVFFKAKWKRHTMGGIINGPPVVDAIGNFNWS